MKQGNPSTTVNQNFILISALLALGLAGMGCNKSGKLAQHSDFSPPAGPVELKLKWPAGERVLQEMDTTQAMDLSIPGRTDPLKQQMTMEQEYGLTVLKATPDGEREVEMEFLNVRVGMTFGSKALPNYDSEKPSPSDQANPLAKLFEKVIGSKIQFFLNASNAVERMEGADVLAAKLASDDGPDLLDGFRNQYSEGNLKQMMSANLFMPTTAVQPGDTWPVHIEFPMGTLGTMVVDDKFAFQNWEMHGPRNCASLEFQGTVTNRPDANADPDRISVAINSGDASGTSWFDPELGITIDTTMKLNMNMVITRPIRRRDDPDATARTQQITGLMNQITTVKLISVK